MGSAKFSITYQTSARDRPLSSIRVRAAAGDPRRGWLTADGWTVPVALGRGGILANKREGDGGTPRGTFQPVQVWWRADRHPRPIARKVPVVEQRPLCDQLRNFFGVFGMCTIIFLLHHLPTAISSDLERHIGP